MDDDVLSKKDRMVFINQFRILEKLYPEESEYFAKHRIALEHGYALHYEWLYEHLFDEMPKEQCQEVIDILNMYRLLHYCYDNLKEKAGIERQSLRFPGFDANYEASLYLYTEYFLLELDRFRELHPEHPGGLKSHSVMLPTYQAMLRQLSKCKDKNNLTKEEIAAILSEIPT